MKFFIEMNVEEHKPLTKLFDLAEDETDLQRKAILRAVLVGYIRHWTLTSQEKPLIPGGRWTPLPKSK